MQIVSKLSLVLLLSTPFAFAMEKDLSETTMLMQEKEALANQISGVEQALYKKQFKKAIIEKLIKETTVDKEKLESIQTDKTNLMSDIESFDKRDLAKQQRQLRNKTNALEKKRIATAYFLMQGARNAEALLAQTTSVKKSTGWFSTLFGK